MIVFLSLNVEDIDVIHHPSVQVSRNVLYTPELYVEIVEIHTP